MTAALLLCLPPDPTLTSENVDHVMAKVDPKEREEVCERVLGYNTTVIKKIQKQYSTDSEREMAYIDAYINCCPWSSWQHLAKVLYQHHHVAAVEDARSYLPPRGRTYVLMLQ